LDNTSPCTLDQARAAKPQVRAAFEQLGMVVGVGITRVGSGYAVKVNLQSKLPDQVAIPETIEGVPVQVEVVGPLHKA
jgi:hypothetical protein